MPRASAELRCSITVMAASLKELSAARTWTEAYGDACRDASPLFFTASASRRERVAVFSRRIQDGPGDVRQCLRILAGVPLGRCRLMPQGSQPQAERHARMHSKGR